MATPCTRLLMMLCCSALVMACGFDSRTLSAPRSQRAAAAKLTPELDDSGPPASTLLRPLRMRVYVSREHQTESPAWQKHLAERVAEANRVLAADLEARIQLEQPRDWPLAESTETLDKSLAALRAMDPGQDVDFVLGLVASEPKLSFAFQELGLAQLFGKHLVLRAANDARELDAIEQSFGQLSAGERQKLYRSRRAHKGAAVLLHELAHAWGAPHTRDGNSVLNARYSPKGTGFGAEAARFLGVAFRFRYTHSRNDHAMARALLKELDRSRTTWVASERDALVARPDKYLENPEAPPARATTGGGLPADDQKRVALAQSQLAAGDAPAAWKSATPLFERYPDNYEIQELRCNIAMRRSLPYAEVRKECKRLMALSPGTKGWR